jgi:hypothetical protein
VRAFSGRAARHARSPPPHPPPVSPQASETIIHIEMKKSGEDAPFSLLVKNSQIATVTSMRQVINFMEVT